VNDVVVHDGRVIRACGLLDIVVAIIESEITWQCSDSGSAVMTTPVCSFLPDLLQNFLRCA